MAEVPSYEVRGDNMHIIWRDLELVLPVKTMLAGMAGASEALAKWQVSRLDKVVAFPGKH
jgi:hypothetical protein